MKKSGSATVSVNYVTLDSLVLSVGEIVTAEVLHFIPHSLFYLMHCLENPNADDFMSFLIFLFSTSLNKNYQR